MTFVSGWVMSILGIVVLGTVIDILLTKSRLKNYIRSVFATVSVLVIITPLPAIINNGFDISFSDILGQVELDENFIDYSNGLKVRAMENALVTAFEQEGISGLEVTVEAEFDGGEPIVKRVEIDLRNSVIKENIANINKYEFIKERVKSFIGNREVQIVING